jgi:outer membrane protein OmpA-like peptidoglycan-associated protein
MYSNAKEGNWSRGRTLLNKKDNKDFNQGMGKVSRDEKIMYFPGYDLADETGNCDILKANMRKDDILSIDKLGDKVNSKHWDSQPSINCEGKSLYFVSKRPGGYGGTDIWVSHLQEDGSWTEAINLGDKINTPMDEESPFIADDNVTLYFASNGHPGYGDMDIFYARNSEEGAWSTPQNLGKPVNSSSREISFFMNARGNKGYIASERKGGYGGLDIYEFNMPAKEDYEEIAYIKGRVMDENTKEPIESIVYISDKGNYKTDKEGRFFVCHPTLSQLKVLVSERKYQDYKHSFELTNWNSEGFVEIDIYLRPLNQAMNIARLESDLQAKSATKKEEKIDVKTVEVKKEILPTEEIYTTSDVYFYFDEFILTKEARYSIDRLIEDIDRDQLALIVVEGFADQIGTDDYNQKLSEKRALEVANYFKSKGLTNLKIKYKGYGETRSSLIYSENRKVEIFIYYKI